MQTIIRQSRQSRNISSTGDLHCLCTIVFNYAQYTFSKLLDYKAESTFKSARIYTQASLHHPRCNRPAIYWP